MNARHVRVFPEYRASLIAVSPGARILPAGDPAETYEPRFAGQAMKHAGEAQGE
jgi:hypothetical protein